MQKFIQAEVGKYKTDYLTVGELKKIFRLHGMLDNTTFDNIIIVVESDKYRNEYRPVLCSSVHYEKKSDFLYLNTSRKS